LIRGFQSEEIMTVDASPSGSSQVIRLRGPSLRIFSLLSALLVLVASGCADGSRSADADSAGAEIFAERCAVCHALPILESLFEQNRGRPPGFVYDALTRGNMRRVGAGLDDAGRRAVAEFFTGIAFDSSAAERDFTVSPRCSPERSGFDWADMAYTSWGRTARNQRSIPDASGFSRAEVERLSVEWVVAFPEASQLRSHPTAAGGALFAGSHNGSVYALDQETGCTRWHFKAATEVRTAVTIEADRSGGAEPIVRAVFADRAANAYALDAETGELLWTTSVDPHPNAAITGSVTAWEGTFFVPVSSNDDVNSMDPEFPCCKHHGAVVALDARDGKILWRRPTIDEEPRISGETRFGTPIWGPSGASIWNTPTLSVERGLLYVGTGNNHSRPATSMSDSILAIEAKTGRVAWVYQAQAEDAWNAACAFGSRWSCPDPEGPDTDFGGTTVLLEHEGRELLVAGQKAGILHALDPDTGELVWRARVARGGPEAGIRFGLAAREGTLFVPSTDQGSAERLGMAARPGLFAFDALDGAPLWAKTREDLCAGREGCDGAMSAPPLAMRDVVFAPGVDGMLYAFDPGSGEIVWRFDTAREFTSLLGRPTRGGGIQGTAGPMYANGRLFVSSGYGQAQRPGNALIALAPE
jgi:polyvinyl alcohol dehydrogenase (cytochrome)